MTVWTISVEFQFYAVFVLVWFLYGKLPMRDAWLIGAVAAFAILAVVFADAGRINLVRYLHLFTGGLVLSVMLRRPTSVTVREAAAICFPILLVGYGVAFFTVPHFYQHDLVYSDLIAFALCAALIYVTVAAPNCWVAKLLSLPPAVWAGEISFGVYLIHRPVQWAINQLLPDWSGVRVFPLLFFVTILLSSLAFLYYERPARRILRKAGESFRFTWQLRRAENR